MIKRAALLAAFLCAVIVSGGASAQDLSVSPNDFGIDPAAMPAPLPPPAELQAQQVSQAQGEPTGNFLTVAPVPVLAPVGAVPVVPAPVPGTDLRAAAPDLYASLSATVTATTGDPSIPVVVRPATTAQALDAAGVPVNLAGIAAQGSPVVDWNSARAGTPYPVETPGQPGVVTYVVPIQVPVYVQPSAQGAQSAPVMPAAAPVAPVAQQTVLPVPQGGMPVVAAAQAGNPFANIIAVTPGAQHVVPNATAAIAGNGGVFYYGQNPVSIASALGYDTATGMEFLDFNAMPSGAVNLVTPAQIKHALLRQTPLVILDVRSDLVRDVDGHIIGDVSVPLQPVDTFAARLSRAIPEKNLPVVVYCENGYWSSQAADALLAMGYKTFLMGSYRLWL